MEPSESVTEVFQTIISITLGAAAAAATSTAATSTTYTTPSAHIQTATSIMSTSFIYPPNSLVSSNSSSSLSTITSTSSSVDLAVVATTTSTIGFSDVTIQPGPYITTANNISGSLATTTSPTSSLNPTTTTAGIPGSDSSASSPNTADIIGAAVGGIAAMCLLGLLIFCIRRRRRKNQAAKDRAFMHLNSSVDDISPFPHPKHIGDMNQYSDSPSSSARRAGYDITQFPHPERGGDGVGEGLDPTKSHLSPCLQSSGHATSNDPFEDQPVVRQGPGQHPQIPNTNTMPQTDWHDRRTGHMKEAEAVGHHGVIVIQQEANSEDSGVVQHRDAGRLLRDVPPAYDSIMQ